jgi:hypothetical protein
MVKGIFTIKNKLLYAISICIFLISPFAHVKAQTFFTCKIRLLFSSKQINERNNNYLRIREAKINGKKLVITLSNKRKLTFSMDTLWGYQIKEYGTMYRAYKGRLYRVEKVGGLILYSGRDYLSDFLDYIYYFSYTLSSEIYIIDRRTLKKIFSKNECMLKKLRSLNPFQDLYDWCEEEKTIRFMVWCKECNVLKGDSIDYFGK